MKLIVGLGNPGSRYEGTRHNIGHAVCDKVAKRFDKKFRRSFTAKCKVARFTYCGHEVMLVKPLTYMNLSGSAVRRLVNRYSLDIASDLLIIVDDADLPLGRLRFRKQGSSAGHRGLSSVIDALGKDNIARLRVGIGRPEQRGASLVDFVLEPFSADERHAAREALSRAQEASLAWVKDGPGAAMQHFNG